MYPANDSHFFRELARVNQMPFLNSEDEHSLAIKVRAQGDMKAREALIISHERLVYQIALKYRNFKLPLEELASAGKIGLIIAVDKFDPHRSKENAPDQYIRFSTYAEHWIKSQMFEYICKQVSSAFVSLSTSTKAIILHRGLVLSMIDDKGSISDDNAKKLYSRLLPKSNESLNVFLNALKKILPLLHGGDQSLNLPAFRDKERGVEKIHLLSDDRPDQETILVEKKESERHLGHLHAALKTLKPRQLTVFRARHLSDNPQTLANLSSQLGVSRERVRQIDIQANEKVTNFMKCAEDGTAPRAPLPAEAISSTAAATKVKRNPRLQEQAKMLSNVLKLIPSEEARVFIDIRFRGQQPGIVAIRQGTTTDEIMKLYTAAAHKVEQRFQDQTPARKGSSRKKAPDVMPA